MGWIQTWAHAACWALFAAAALAQTPPAADLPPAEAFYRRADIVHAELSPSGRWLALLSTLRSERSNLVVFDVQGDSKPTVAARFADLDVDEFTWVNDDRLVFDTLDYKRGVGELRWAPGLFSVHRDGSELRMLIAFDRPGVVERRTGREPLAPNHLLLHVPNDGSDQVIVGEYRYDQTGEPVGIVAKRLNVVTGIASTQPAGTPANITRWWFDSRGEARLVRARSEGRVRLYWRKPGAGAPWEMFAEHDAFEPPFTPHSIDAAGNLYVVQARGAAGTDVLTRFDFTTREPVPEALVSTPGFDFSGSIVSETPGSRTLGVRVETDAETTAWFDPGLKALQKEADERFPGRVNRLSCRRCDHDDMVVLVQSFSDRDPGEYHVYRADKKQWRHIIRVRSAIDPRRMGYRDLHRVKARDGMEIPVWVTTPPGPPSKTPRPTVVLVHGGPWLRGGHWRWSADAQFLASRGYLVIEPEFRGSTGYGAKLYSAGLRQWGLSMQDDVADALLWAVDKGYADAKRACIAGGSYGGYATLMGLVRQPELYRCGAAWMAVTDPRLMFNWTYRADQSDEVRRYTYPALIGDPVADAAMLTEAAPLTHAAKIKAPLLLAAGGHDTRVPPEHMTRMRDALTAAGNAPQFVMYDMEGHGWIRYESHADFARRLERFLAENLE